MKPYRFHVAALPHTRVTTEFSHCAYTQKVRLFCAMMHRLGHKVICYGPEGSTAEGENVAVITTAEQREYFGEPSNEKGPPADLFDDSRPWWKLVNERTIAEIQKRRGPQDFVCLIAGVCQASIYHALRETTLPVEFGVGYHGTVCNHRIFESYAHLHHVHGRQGEDRGRFFDAVVPNYIDPAQFPEGDGLGGYHLFVGRVIRNKGLRVAVEALRRTGDHLLVAGQGVKEAKPGRIVAEDGEVYEADGLTYVGVADAELRANLMGRATALWVPTIYLGPFETVHVEAQACGTPVITTDWGVFTETMIDGRNGFRCRTLAEFVDAAEAVSDLNRRAIRRHALWEWGIDAVALKYQRVFDRLATLWGEGWTTTETSPVLSHAAPC